MSQDETPKAPQNRREEIAGVAVVVALIIAAIAYFVGYKNANESIRPIIAAGNHHSFALDIDGKLYATGTNKEGKLGLGDKIDRDAWTLVPPFSDKNVVAIAATWMHSLALDSDGKVYATGENKYGQLGLGDTKNRDIFTLVSPFSDKKIVAISAGDDHSLALDIDGKVYAAGDNGGGQLGLGDKVNRASFALVSSLEGKKIAAISASGAHSFALDKFGRLYAAGSNEYGEIGLGDDETDNFQLVSSFKGKKIVAIAAIRQSFALDEDGRVYGAGDNYLGQLSLGENIVFNVFAPVKLFNDKKIAAIAAGDGYLLALDSDGNVSAAGNNEFGQLGLGDDDSYKFQLALSSGVQNIIAIAAGGSHSLALDSDGKIYATGYSGYGQLGVGDADNRRVFTPITLPDR